MDLKDKPALILVFFKLALSILCTFFLLKYLTCIIQHGIIAVGVSMTHEKLVE